MQFGAWNLRAEAVPTAEDALEALNKAANENDPFIVAFIDMLMPGMNGEELGEKILADDVLKNTLLIMISSSAQRGDAKRFSKIGFSAFFTKPIHQSDLFDNLVNVLAGKSAQHSHPINPLHVIPKFQQNDARILLAEDNIVNQQVALGILNKLGIKADAVANGFEVINALERISYDLVLMDVQMPEMDGLEATRKIRNHDSNVLNHNIPIVAMTANAMKGDDKICLQAGMDDYIPKPVNPNELAIKLKKWLPGIKIME